jgi:hypothetical protein
VKWLKWHESPDNFLPWSVSNYNRTSHCLDATDTKERSVPAQRGVLYHDTAEDVVKRVCDGEILDLSDPQTIMEIMVPLADAKGFGNDVLDEARAMFTESVNNGLFDDLNTSEALGIEVGIAMEVYLDNAGEPKLRVVPWKQGYEYDASPEEKASVAGDKLFYRGKADRLMVRRDTDGKVRCYVLDYKTSLYMEDEETFKRLPNGYIYCWAINKYLRQIHNIVIDEFVYRHCYARYNNARRGLVIMASELPEIEEKILETIESRINRKTNIRVRGPYCKYCGRNEEGSCELGAAMDLQGKDWQEELVSLYNSEVYHLSLAKKCEKQREKLLKEKGGDTPVVRAGGLEFRLDYRPQREWDFSPLLKFTELGQKLADKLDARGKPITVNDVVQVKPSSCNDFRMPHIVEKVATVQYYKRATKTAKAGDMKKDSTMRSVKTTPFKG